MYKRSVQKIYTTGLISTCDDVQYHSSLGNANQTHNKAHHTPARMANLKDTDDNKRGWRWRNWNPHILIGI